MSINASQEKVKIAASPINWHNDDFPLLGENTSVDTILSEMKEAGFSGTALSSLFPSTAGELKPILDHFELELASGWFSAYILSRPWKDEVLRFKKFVKFLSDMNASLLTIAECTYCPFKPFPAGRFREHVDALKVPLFPYQLPTLDNQQWDTVAKGLTEFSKIAYDSGISLGYHPHMQTIVQNEEQLAILADKAPELNFTIDTGHLSFAGSDAVEIVKQYIDRVVYLHIKNTRLDRIKYIRETRMSFEWAVIEGAFTVPGDGGIDFANLFEFLKLKDYSGWLLVEAEQNPLTSNPMLYAKLAREYIKQVTNW